MPWESDEEPTKPSRDWVKYMWIAVAVLIVVGVIVMFAPREQRVDATRARVSHILVKVEGRDAAAAEAAYSEIEALREQILNGANFARLAAEHSDDKFSAPRGGDLGWVHRQELATVIDEYVWQASLNEVSNVLLSGEGLHLVVVRDRQLSAADQYEIELKERVLQGQTSGDQPSR